MWFKLGLSPSTNLKWECVFWQSAVTHIENETSYTIRMSAIRQKLNWIVLRIRV